MASDFQDLKTKVFATVATDAENHTKGCNLTNLVRNFFNDWSHSLTDDCQKLGYSSVITLLKEMPDMIKVHGNPYEPESLLIFPIFDEALDHQRDLIQDSDASKKPKKRFAKQARDIFKISMDLQQSLEELTLLDDVPIYCVYPVSSGLRHRYLLELVQYKKELKEEPKNFGAKAMIEEVEEKLNELGDTESTFGDFRYFKVPKLLTDDELMPCDKNFISWAKKDSFRKHPVCFGGVGLMIMEKMGFEIGQGLGKFGQGIKEPVLVDIKKNKRCLSSDSDYPAGVKGLIERNDNPVQLLNTICVKKGWLPPVYGYNVVRDGPNNFWYSQAILNDESFTLVTKVKSKKEGRLRLAIYILEQLFHFTSPVWQDANFSSIQNLDNSVAI
uniref:G-patch domain-containing protein n=1 Tax=Acrobeloides nanus TaxID=290746 RepID=A0A914DQU3_9BILA